MLITLDVPHSKLRCEPSQMYLVVRDPTKVKNQWIKILEYISFSPSSEITMKKIITRRVFFSVRNCIRLARLIVIVVIIGQKQSLQLICRQCTIICHNQFHQTKMLVRYA